MLRMSSLVVATLLVFCALPAVAGTPINQTHALSPTGEVHVENIKGRIVVRTWSRPEVRITGTLGKGAEKLEVRGDSGSVDIAVKYPHLRGGWNFWGRSDSGEPTLLEVTIPQRASLDVEAVSADVDVQQMAGKRLSVSSVSGRIEVTASSPGEADLENVSGDILAKITTPRAQVESVSGDVQLQGGLDGEVSVETVSGDVDLVARSLSQLKLSSVSGDITARTALRPDAEVEGETLSGALTLHLPRATSASLHVETFSGDIDSPAGKVHREEHGPGKSLDARIGDGRGEIKLESFSGDVRVVLD